MQTGANALRFHDQSLDLLLQQPLTISRTCRGSLSDHGPDARSHLEPALMNEVLYDLVSSVGMNLEVSRQSSYRRECLAALELSAQESLLRREHDLIKD